jgi:hypothetical protein
VKVENGERGKEGKESEQDVNMEGNDRFLELASPTLSYCCKSRSLCHPKEALARVQSLSTPGSSSPSRLRSESSELGAGSLESARSLRFSRVVAWKR